MLAALSLGPVGISDQLTTYPTNINATITSNVPLVMTTCAATGDLLQPSYPLVALDRAVARALESPTVTLWGTYTAVPGAAAAARWESDQAHAPVSVWYSAMAFCNENFGCKMSSSQAASVTVRESDLAPMVDSTSLPTGNFADIPLGNFSSEGSTFATGGRSSGAADGDVGGHVVWEGMPLDTAGGCGAVKVYRWNSTYTTSIHGGDSGTLVNVAPVMGPKAIALLGEGKKMAAISTYRFASIATAADGSGGISISLRGKPAEPVLLLFAVRSATLSAGEYACKSQIVNIGANGTAVIVFSG